MEWTNANIFRAITILIAVALFIFLMYRLQKNNNSSSSDDKKPTTTPTTPTIKKDETKNKDENEENVLEFGKTRGGEVASMNLAPQTTSESQLNYNVSRNRQYKQEWEQLHNVQDMELGKTYLGDKVDKITFRISDPFTLIFYDPKKSGQIKFLSDNTTEIMSLTFDTKQKHHIMLAMPSTPSQMVKRITRTDGRLTDSQMTVVRYNANTSEVFVNTEKYSLYATIRYIMFEISFSDAIFHEYGRPFYVDGKLLNK